MYTQMLRTESTGVHIYIYIYIYMSVCVLCTYMHTPAHRDIHIHINIHIHKMSYVKAPSRPLQGARGSGGPPAAEGRSSPLPGEAYGCLGFWV